tara:strand:+ start:4363 stop:5358 length:996 start_codon:yes stop_codon:yes gene_type:complete
MFKGKTFYHSHIRKAIVAFGTIFNDINIVRKDSAGVEAQSMRVPLAYATKQKFLTRIEQIPTVESRGEVAIVLPRIGFELIGLNYDPTRKVSPIQQHRKTISSNALSVSSQFVSTPYDLTIAMYIIAKNQEDGLQILEQILPYFNPDFNITINDLPEMGIKRDIKIVMDGIGYEDNTAGNFADRQSLVWTLNFTMKLNFYGYVADQGIIRKAIASVFQNPNMLGPRSRQQFTITEATATATATLTGGAVTAVTIVYAGTGYTKQPNVILTGNARAHAVMSNDGTSINNIVIDDAGSGYGAAPTITIEAPDLNNQKIDDAYRFLEEFDQTYE